MPSTEGILKLARRALVTNLYKLLTLSVRMSGLLSDVQLNISSFCCIRRMFRIGISRHMLLKSSLKSLKSPARLLQKQESCSLVFSRALHRQRVFLFALWLVHFNLYVVVKPTNCFGNFSQNVTSKYIFYAVGNFRSIHSLVWYGPVRSKDEK